MDNSTHTQEKPRSERSHASLEGSAPWENPIPPQVRRQVEQAEEIARRLQEGESVQSSAPEAPDSPVQADASAQEPASTAGEASLRPGPAEEPAGPGSGAPAGPAPQHQPAPSSPPDYEQRYRTLQGKYDAEVPRLNTELSRYNAENMQLRSLLADLQARDAYPPAQGQRGAPSPSVNIPDEDATEYGEDLITAARRWARAEIQPELETMRAELGQLRGGQQRVETQSMQQHIAQGLNSVPELGGGVWQQLNNDPDFLAWLNQVDPFAGVSRFEMLRHATGVGDVARISRFFTAYLQEHTAADHASGPAHTHATNGHAQGAGPNGAGAGPHRSLASLAAPGRAAGAATSSGAPQKRIWSTAQIKKHFKDVVDGRYQGREADQRRVEEDIVAAQREGRIEG